MTIAERLKALEERALYPSWTRDELAAIRAEVEAVAKEMRGGHDAGSVNELAAYCDDAPPRLAKEGK